MYHWLLIGSRWIIHCLSLRSQPSVTQRLWCTWRHKTAWEPFSLRYDRRQSSLEIIVANEWSPVYLLQVHVMWVYLIRNCDSLRLVWKNYKYLSSNDISINSALIYGYRRQVSFVHVTTILICIVTTLRDNWTLNTMRTCVYDCLTNKYCQVYLHNHDCKT